MDLSSSLTVIGWFVQVLLDQGITFAIDHWGGAGAAPDLPEALAKLREAINYVGALLPTARKIRSENQSLVGYVNDLKDAAYDAEDILSELDYYRLQEEVEGNDNSNNTSFGSSMIDAAGRVFSQLLLTNEDTKASTSSPPPSVFDNKVTIMSPPLYIYTIIPRINEVVARLDRIISGVSRVLTLLKSEEERDADSHVSTSHRVTTSFVSSKQTMVGREDTKAHIIDVLLNGQPAAASASDVWVLPIIGAGGIGKTTLAREVYNDKRVVEHFECRLWLYVSENFDITRLTRDMLEQLRVKGLNHIKNLQQLQTLLMENLGSKKFFLVMDDVWNDADSQKWKTLCAPLEYGKPGSRILLTTRLDTVVEMVGKEAMNVFGCSVELKGLPEEEYLSLFNKYAFGDKQPSDHSNLAETGKQIAGKLDGSPLAAKTVGSLLRESLDVEYWTSILSSDIWKLPQRHDDIMPVLKLSYQHLPAHLQQCFAYCCVFPKGMYIYTNELVRMWIAQGYIDTKTSENKRMEDIGYEYYKILLARSFLEEGSVHDLFHDLAQSVSADESFTIDTNNQKVPRRVRHLSITSDHITLVLTKSYLRNLRTLIIFEGKDFERFDLLEELLNELKGVRVLYIPWLDLKDLPHNIGHLIHLRYIHVRYIRERSLCRLYHLQYLQCWDVHTFSVRHRIEKLPCLQELKYFVIEEGRKIGVLKNLNQLGGDLTLENLENVYTKEEALEAELSKKIHIRHLKLIWKDSRTLPEVAQEVFEGIRPPAYIKSLWINGYGGVNTPSWMLHEIRCFSNLESIYLFNCLKWKDLPPLGQLPLLRYLMIRKADAVEVIGRGFYGTGDAKGFQCLEKLEFRSMPQLVVWSGIGDDAGFLFPRLRKLTIYDCPKLEQVPDFLFPQLRELSIEDCPKLEQVPDFLFPQLRELTIYDCPKLEQVPMKDLTSLKRLNTNCMSLLVHPEYLLSLEELDIKRFEEPMSVELKSFPSLKKVTLRFCDRLQSLPRLPTMLEVLQLEYLNLLTNLTMEQGEKLSDLSSLRELQIWDCPHLSSLPLLPASLKKLGVWKCPRLNSLPLLPATLEKLLVSECPELPRERYQEGGDEWINVSHIRKIDW